MKIEACPVCDSQKIKKLFEKVSDGVQYNLDICSSCGVFFVNPLPEDFSLNKLYGEEYFTSRDYEGKDKYRLRVASKRLKQIENTVKTQIKDKRILEVGAAMGHFLKKAEDKKAKVYGVELSGYAVKRAKEKFGLNIFEGRLEDSNFINEKFDFIFGWDLFEHLKNPNEFLKMCYSMLNENGHLVLHIPFSESPGYKLKNINWPKINPKEHLFYYNQKAMSILAKKHSYKEIEIPFSWLKISDLYFNDTKTLIFKKSNFFDK